MPGHRRETHLAAALGLALIEKVGASCLLGPPIYVQSFRSHAAISPSKPRSPNSTNIICSILDDLAYVTKDQAETTLFELI